MKASTDCAAPLLIAGVDEAGRGPLAGPVVAAAVVLDPAQPIEGLRDSKRLSAARRVTLADEIRARALAWALGSAAVEEIDRLNILEATLLAMQRAVGGLGLVPERILVDGNRLPAFAVPAAAVVGGDGAVPAISAASILAKVTRDALMHTLAERHPGYGFEVHKGYPTPGHRQALARLGPSPIHRMSFAPVRAALPGAREYPA
ncbi:MAG: ribonuclease HII [Pseudomonadales bacterium]|nr:ribonuclease HII [Pseudomonadales bacterium]